jgi:hypothetical protein
MYSLKAAVGVTSNCPAKYKEVILELAANYLASSTEEKQAPFVGSFHPCSCSAVNNPIGK